MGRMLLSFVEGSGRENRKEQPHDCPSCGCLIVGVFYPAESAGGGHIGAGLVVEDEHLDLLVFVGHVPDPFGVDAAVRRGFMRDADAAAGGLLAEAVTEQGEVRSVLFGRRDFAEVIAAADADGVLGVALPIVIVGAAARDGKWLSASSVQTAASIVPYKSKRVIS